MRVGLSNLNTTSMENLLGQAGNADVTKSVFDHTIRSGAPVNHLEPINSKAGKVVAAVQTHDNQFHDQKALITSESRLHQLNQTG